MVDNEYWDAEEYSFFSELNNNDKLMYIYEIMLAKYSFRFIDNDLDGDFDDFDDDFDDDSSEDAIDEFELPSANTTIKLTGKNLESLNSIKNLMLYNGLLIQNSKVEYTDDGYIVMSLSMLGKSHPICVN